MKLVGKPGAGNRHARFDERGWETGRCRMAQVTAPILDSTFAHPPAERLDPGRLVRAVLFLTHSRASAVGGLDKAYHQPSFSHEDFDPGRGCSNSKSKAGSGSDP